MRTIGRKFCGNGFSARLCAKREKQRCRILALQSRIMPSSRTATPKSAKLQVITADSFAGIEWLRHGFSTRKGGVSKCYGGKSLNLGLTEDDTREAVNANRELFFREIDAVDNPTLAKAARVGHPHSEKIW